MLPRSAPHLIAACLIAACLIGPLPAHAADEAVFPGLITVVDVAADDVLNIRDKPDISGNIIGSLAPDATGIEVTATENGWLRVNRPEQSGWINARHAAFTADIWPENGLPEDLTCSGTEPFWAFEVAGSHLRFSTPETSTEHDNLRVMAPFDGARNPRRALAADGLMALITPAAACSDGMSGMLYALDVDMLIGSGAEARYYRGCCSIAPRNR